MCVEATKEKKRQWQKDYRERHQDRVKNTKARWEANNPEKKKLYHDRWVETHQEQIKEYRKKYYREHPGKSRADTEKWKANNYNRFLEIVKTYKRNNPEKVRAQNTVANHVRRKTIVKPETCSICLLKKRIYAHHYDYSNPLDVIWVCQKCHMKIHRDIREADKEANHE